MESEIFDRETMLDLTVNFIPLGIILFFFGVYSIYAPWGFELMPSGQMFGIMGIMFVALLILTYVSAKAIAGDEKRATVYAQGQAGLDGAKPLHEIEDDAEAHGAETSREADGMEPEAGAADAETDNEAGAADAESATETTDNEAGSADAETVDDEAGAADAESATETADDGADDDTDFTKSA